MMCNPYNHYIIDFISLHMVYYKDRIPSPICSEIKDSTAWYPILKDLIIKQLIVFMIRNELHNKLFYNNL